MHYCKFVFGAILGEDAEAEVYAELKDADGIWHLLNTVLSDTGLELAMPYEARPFYLGIELRSQMKDHNLLRRAIPLSVLDHNSGYVPLGVSPQELERVEAGFEAIRRVLLGQTQVDIGPGSLIWVADWD